MPPSSPGPLRKVPVSLSRPERDLSARRVWCRTAPCANLNERRSSSWPLGDGRTPPSPVTPISPRTPSESAVDDTQRTRTTAYRPGAASPAAPTSTEPPSSPWPENSPRDAGRPQAASPTPTALGRSTPSSPPLPAVPPSHDRCARTSCGPCGTAPGSSPRPEFSPSGPPRPRDKACWATLQRAWLSFKERRARTSRAASEGRAMETTGTRVYKNVSYCYEWTP